MKRFAHGHATHPDWRMALALAAAQVDAQLGSASHGAAAAGPPTLGWLYFTDHCAPHAVALLADVQRRWPGVAWVGGVGVGVAASGVEYFDEPALVLMLAALPAAQFRVFSGARPLGDFAAHTAHVHADPSTADLAELIGDMSDRTATGYLFGGLASARTDTLHIAGEVLRGGLSGVAFTRAVALVSRVTQGCQPVGPQRRISEVDRNVVTALDGEPALDCLLRDLGVSGTEPRDALPRLRQTLVGLSDPRDTTPHRAADGPRDPASHRGAFGPDVRVRHLVGLDPARRGIAIADHAEVGMQLAFCARDQQAARRDLVRICSEIRDEVEPESLPLAAAIALKNADASETASNVSHGIAGAVYVTCAGRGGPHFGAPSAELQIVQRALGDVPLVGFFASGEIARHHLYGYTGVLTVFRS
jgi:small ligand-binding sensory domain FIST